MDLQTCAPETVNKQEVILTKRYVDANENNKMTNVK